MKANRAAFGPLAVFSALVIALSSAGASYAGGPNDYPGVGMGEKFLAAGPMPIVLRIVVKKFEMPDVERKEDAILLLLTDKRLICQFLDEKGIPQKALVVPAGSTATQIRRITTKIANAKTTWDWDYDRRTKSFIGDAKLPERIELKKAPEYTKLQINQFLYFTYLWLADMLEDAALANDRDLAKAVNKKAQRLVEVIDRRDLDPDVKTLLRNLKYYEADLFKLRRDYVDLRDEARRTNEGLRAGLDYIDAVDRYHRNTLTTATGLHLAGVLLGGQNFFTADSLFSFQGRRLLTDLRLKNVWDDERKKQETQIFAKRDELINRALKTLATRIDRQLPVAEKLNLPKVDWYADKYGPLCSKRDWPKLADRYEEIQAELKKITPQGDPWLQLEIYNTRSVAKYPRYDTPVLFNEAIQRNAQKRLDLARKIFDLASSTPGGEDFKELQGELLAKAAEHALAAAELEVGEKASLRNAYSAKAVYALRLLAFIKDYRLEEVNRHLSALKFRAMALCQMHQDALSFGNEFPVPRDAMRYHLTMARLHLVFAAPGSKLEASKEHMKQALKAGFYDFGLMKANPDLKRVLLSPGFVHDNMTAEVSIRILVERGKIKGYVVTNNSPYAIFNGTFAAGRIVRWDTMRYGFRTQKYPIFGKSAVTKIGYLPPNASMTIKELNDINNTPFFQQPTVFNVSVTNYYTSSKDWWFPVKATLER